MPKHDSVDRDRRAVLGAGGALILGAALWPTRSLAQATGGNKLRIGVIGSGHIGGTIGGLWVKAGHPVLFSSRHPDELKDLVAGLGPLAQAGTVAQAIEFGDVDLHRRALRRAAADRPATTARRSRARSCSMPATPSPSRDGAIADEAERDGIGITSQKYLPGTRLVRAFNTLSYMIFAQRGEPARAAAGGADRRRRCRGGEGRGRPGARRGIRAGGRRQAGRCARFQRGGPGYGQPVTAAELRQKLSLAP